MIESHLPANIQAGFEIQASRADTSNRSANFQKALSDASSKEALLRERAQEMEAVFLSKMIEPMIPKDESGQLFGGGSGGDIYRQFMIDEYGKALSRSGGIGLTDQLVKDMISLQEQKQWLPKYLPNSI